MENLQDITLHSYTKGVSLRLADNLALYSTDNCPSQFCPDPQTFLETMGMKRYFLSEYWEPNLLEVTYETLQEVNLEIENKTRAEYGLPPIKPEELT